MKNVLFFLVLILCLISCKKELKLKFVDEFILKDSLLYKNSLVGGLSGVDYANGFYYFVIDDSKSPRILKTKIEFKKDTIFSINFSDIIFLNDSSESFYNDNALDLESIIVNPKTLDINLVSEGSISKGKNPSVFTINTLGNFKFQYKIPSYFNANSPQKPKHNASFESSSRSIDGNGIWVGMESVLEADGVHATFTKEKSPVRITYFNSKTKQATKQYVYPLGKINRPAKGNINLNGIVAVLEYKKDNFFIVERGYQSGYGAQSNSVKIYNAKIEEASTNTLNMLDLNDKKYIPLKKELLLDFKNLKDSLTNGIIDNIEGIAFGPKLSNGNRSLLLVSDDNFQKYGKQLNQFILLEVAEK